MIRREVLPHSQDRTKKVELFWTQPVGDGPYPAVLLIHGHQEPVRNGGEAFVRAGRLGSMASQGYVAASLFSQGMVIPTALPTIVALSRKRLCWVS